MLERHVTVGHQRIKIVILGPGKIVRIKPKFPKPFNKFKHYEKVRQLDKKNRVHPQFMAFPSHFCDGKVGTA